MWYTLVLLLLMSYLLLRDFIETEVVLFGTLILLLLGGLITVEEAFAGFSNEGVLIIAFLFIISGSLSKTNALNYFKILPGKEDFSSKRPLIQSIIPVSVFSAFVNNTPIVSLFIPIVRSWAEKHNISPAKIFIPISYAAILGGMCTLIGSSTNLIVHGIMVNNGLAGLSFFEISKIGIPVAIFGLTFVVLFSNYLLPYRKEPIVDLGEHTREFVIELKVTNNYKNIGKTIEEAGLRHLKGLFLFQIERQGNIIAPAKPEERICENDRLFFTGLPKTILELQKTKDLQLIKNSKFDLKHYDSDEIKPFEAVISPSSFLVGKNVRESKFRGKYNAVIIAIHRSGVRIKKKIGDVVLHAGDTLLLLADKDFHKKWYFSKDFYLISLTDVVPSKPKWQANFSILVLIGMVAITALGILPLITSAAVASLLLILSKSVRLVDTKELIDWKVLIVIASALGISKAVSNSGLASLLAGSLIGISESMGVLASLIGVYLMTNIYSTILTNTAAAAMIIPVVFPIAQTLNADINAFAIVVAIAAGASFATPIGYQTNLMVYGPGGYKFKDYIKIGAPLQILVGIVTIFLIYTFYL